MPLDIDYNACLLKGMIGGIGAIPGTCGSHPFDVIKIRMQVKGDLLSDGVRYKVNSHSGAIDFYENAKTKHSQPEQYTGTPGV